MSGLGPPLSGDHPKDSIVSTRLVIEHLYLPGEMDDVVYVWAGDAAGGIPPLLEMLGLLEMAKVSVTDLAANGDD